MTSVPPPSSTAPLVSSALNVPTATSYPSVNCLQWSSDGQLCFVTKTAIYILTPDHGINFDNTSVIKSSLNKESREDSQALGWFRTIIQFDKSEGIRWPDHSQAWGAASLGSIDLSPSSVAISPSGLSSDGGCVLAMLSSNMDLTLWVAGKNYLKGEWPKAADVTPFLLETHPSEDILKSQVISVAWTPFANFNVCPTPLVNSSFLVIGSRAGSITLLRYHAHKEIEHIHTISVADRWITQLAPSAWSLASPGVCEGYIAYGSADGSVGLIKITQVLQETDGEFHFAQNFVLEVTVERGPELLFGPDKTGITALIWVDIVGRAHSGRLQTWNRAPLDCSWRRIRLDGISFSLNQDTKDIRSLIRIPISVGNCLPSATRHTRVILSDGSFHTIHNLSKDPSWTSQKEDDQITSDNLSKTSRSVFVKAEQGAVDQNDMNRITGTISYDDHATFLWAYETANPSDFSYKHDAKHSSMLIAAQMWEDDEDDVLLRGLANTLNGVRTAIGSEPLHVLRPYLFHLRNQRKLASLHPHFLEILKPTFADHSVDIHIPQCTGEMTPELRRDFRTSLSRHLFGWDVLLSLRMRLSLADFAWKLSISPEQQADCGHVAQGLLNTISHRVLRTIIRHLASVTNCLQPNDVPFALRMVVQSLLPGSPPDLSQEGRDLAALVEGLTSNPSSPISNELNEVCPACKVEVPLQDITTAVCPNGHTWARCSITTFILSTPRVRTCVGCSRKAFLPVSAPNSPDHSWLPPTARGWVVEELLEAVHRCLFCNNSFVSVL
ncbi:uncharacterized protein LACBIDRAFT_318182 [Laccaria bicolor S238N-H82]|uniref:Predicted protein n=1 Tax=Laccaria bicolor (strain S238N-H82 / ATCC MYA-4686) TaxID=486041 RepID=B0D664_LACBS|nr:uncharacterized protein LACBIDRAFT_318182 [Laccaria bicolor S238N-H82]EDR10144.1 predicted protein [Laccaria bicolor S238N-H82]|eukprot:XP_001879529.1 predicted protein [Laccaria bicolor S238N-H82]